MKILSIFLFVLSIYLVHEVLKDKNWKRWCTKVRVICLIWI